MLEKLKEIFGKKEEKKYGMPREYLMVRWKDETKKYGITGDRAKVIVHVKDGKGKKYPYSKERLKSMKKNLKLPVWDKTEGRVEPDIPIEIRIDPSKIEYGEL